MALTEINSKSIKDGEILEEDISISNTPSDGQYLQYKDSSDKLTWSTVTTTPADDSITTAMIQDDAITADKIGTLSDVKWGDNSSVALGVDNDMILYSSGGNGVIRAYLNNKITIASANAGAGQAPDDLAVFNANGSVELYHNDVKKIETSATGVTVTGTVAATAVTGDGSGLTGIDAGATGGGTNKIFWENGQTIDYNYTITDGQNAMSAGPIEIAATGNGDGSAVVVTVGDGETWTIV